jgi:hypothetical protein
MRPTIATIVCADTRFASKFTIAEWFDVFKKHADRRNLEFASCDIFVESNDAGTWEPLDINQSVRYRTYTTVKFIRALMGSPPPPESNHGTRHISLAIGSKEFCAAHMAYRCLKTRRDRVILLGDEVVAVIARAAHMEIIWFDAEAKSMYNAQYELTASAA